MGMKRKIFFTLFGVMCTGLLAPAFSENYQYGGSSQTNDNMQQTDQGMYQHGTYREITPIAGPRVAHGVNAFLTLDLLYWQVVQEGTGFASQGGIKQLNGGTSNVAQGDMQSLGTDWTWGFKAGAGLNLNHDGWDLLALYTFSRAKSEKNIAKVESKFVYPLRFTRCDPNLFNQIVSESAKGKWALHFNEVNLDWGRNSHLSPFLTLRPFLGIKATWQNQTLSSSYAVVSGDHFVLHETSSPHEPIRCDGPYSIEEYFKVLGIGPHSGFDTKWYFSKSFSVYGHLAGSVLWAHYYKQSRKDTVLLKGDDASTAITVIDLCGKRDSTKYVVECGIGFSWENWYCDDGFHILAQLGWDSQIWLDWTNFYEPYRENWYNLNMGGLAFKLRLDF